MRKLVLSAALAVSAGALVMGAIALAEGGPTRSEYASRLEKICKPRAEATARTMDGVRGDVKGHRLEAAAAKFERAGRIFRSTVAAITVVPRPSEDRTTLAKWFRYLKRQEGYLTEIAKALRGGEAIKAQHLTAAFIRSGNRANDVSLDFDFDYCRFKFSRFS
ncbi:MAG TPA: hypothetical protein VF125_02985 [Solirubrobacterales bacterium]